MQLPPKRNLDSPNHGTQNMITTFSLQEAQLDDPREKILLPPTDPKAEVMEIPGYKLVYVNGACPRNYRVYKADSMIGVIFQHLTHWSNAVDRIRYVQAEEAAVGLDDFMKVASILKATTQQPLTVATHVGDVLHYLGEAMGCVEEIVEVKFNQKSES